MGREALRRSVSAEFAAQRRLRRTRAEYVSPGRFRSAFLKQAGNDEMARKAKRMSSNMQGLENTRTATIADNESEAKSKESIELRRVECFVTESLFKRILRRVFPDQRRQERLPVPPLVGYLGTARASKPYELGDISLEGFCLLTGERWIPGTEMPVTLQRTDLPDENDADCFTVQATVVRCDKDGVGFSIVMCEEDSRAAHGNSLRVKWINRAEMARFMKSLTEPPGSQQPNVEAPIPVESTADAPARSGGGLKAAFEGGR